MKVVMIHGFWFLEEALDVIRKVAQVTVPRDGSEEALRDELRDADAVPDRDVCGTTLSTFTWAVSAFSL